MKKLLLFCVMSLLCLTTAMAQEPAICGDWIGVYQMDVISDDVDSDGSKYFVKKDFRGFIRVKLIDGCYTVRMKTRIADNSKPFNYWPECHIEHADERSITWIFDHGDNYDWDSTSKEQGIRIGHSHSITRCWVTLTNGVLKYTDLYFTTYYDTQGREITTKKWDYPGMRKTFTLYKEEQDW